MTHPHNDFHPNDERECILNQVYDGADCKALDRQHGGRVQKLLGKVATEAAAPSGWSGRGAEKGTFTFTLFPRREQSRPKRHGSSGPTSESWFVRAHLVGLLGRLLRSPSEAAWSCTSLLFFFFCGAAAWCRNTATSWR